MRLRLIPASFGLIWFAMNVPAYGVTCYQIWDAQETLAYQSAIPPFDLSSPAYDRSMTNLRNQRGQLIFFESSDCAIAGNGIIGPQSRVSRDPATLLVDIRSAGDPGGSRSSGGMLMPVPAGAVAAPVGATGGSGSARPAAGTGVGTSTRR